MPETLTTPWFKLDPRELTPDRFSEHLDESNPFDHTIAAPLFKAGVACASMACRKGYRSNRAYLAGCHNVRLLLQGKQTVQHGDKMTPLRPGDLAYCPPDVKLHYSSAPDSITWWLYFKIDDIPGWDGLKRRGAFVKPSYSSGDLMFFLLRRLLDARRTANLASMITATEDSRILLSILRRLCSPDQMLDERILALRQLVGDIAENPTADWKQAVLADRLCISPRTLLRLFKSEYGCTPIEMVVQQRLNHAIYLLLNTRESVGAVAFQCGYENVSSFSRTFRKHVGVPPGQFRSTSRTKTL